MSPSLEPIVVCKVRLGTGSKARLIAYAPEGLASAVRRLYRIAERGRERRAWVIPAWAAEGQ